jgi:hypothetical protein
LHIPSRHRIESDGVVVWAWPGSYAEFTFMGPGFIATVEGEGKCVRLSVDGRSLDFGPLPKGPQRLVWDVESRAYDHVHIARIQTTNEDSLGFFRILDLAPKGPASLLERPMQTREHHIEWVGDSWTCGYGNLSPDSLVSDCTKSFASIAAESMNADYSLIAISGHGLVKNFGETPPSRNTILSKYPRAFPEIPPSIQWSGRVADIGAVLIGENDFSFAPYPEPSAFIATYRKLLNQMRTRHKGIRIWILAVDRPHQGPSLARQVFDLERTEGYPVELLEVPNLDETLAMGYNWHPGLAHHAQMAKTVAAAITSSLTRAGQ